MSDYLWPHECITTGFVVHNQLQEIAETHVHQVGDAMQLFHPLSSPSPPAFSFSQQQGLFQWISFFCIRWPKYQGFSFSISLSNEYSQLISFKIDWLDLLAVPGNLKSLHQHHSSKVSILQHSAFFTVQLLHPYMTTGKTIALIIWTSVSKVISLFFNMLSCFVTPDLPKSKCLLNSWLQSPSAVIWSPRKWDLSLFSFFFPSICYELIGPDAMILVFWLLNFKSITFLLFSFTFIKRLFISSSLSAIRMVSSAYLRLLIFLPGILIPACASSSLAFHMMYSSCNLCKQGGNIQPWLLLSQSATSPVFHVLF